MTLSARSIWLPLQNQCMWGMLSIRLGFYLQAEKNKNMALKSTVCLLKGLQEASVEMVKLFKQLFKGFVRVREDFVLLLPLCKKKAV